MPRVGFVMNPIAGMGGRVGLKGTDDMVHRAVELGAQPVAKPRSMEALREIKRLLAEEPDPIEIEWLTSAGAMGAEALSECGFDRIQVVAQASAPSTSEDTKDAVRKFLEYDAGLILFCGGDGTARDIAGVAGKRVAMLGIPSGVKMYSGVFGVTPASTAMTFVGYLKHELTVAEAEVLDLDEAKYRAGEWAVRLFYSVVTPFEPTLTQVSKEIVTEASDDEVKAEIAREISDDIAANPGVLYILGAGSTLQAIGAAIGIRKTLLGIDAALNGRLVGEDLNERSLTALIGQYPDCRLILSPIGAQGFVLGRGNLQISPQVIRQIGLANILVVATPSKLARTPQLKFDTGDAGLDSEIAGLGFLPVVVGYRRRRMVRIACYKTL